MDNNKKPCKCIENNTLEVFLAHFSGVAVGTGIDAAQFFMRENVCSRAAARVMMYSNIVGLATIYGAHIAKTEGKPRAFTPAEVDMLYDFMTAGVEEVRNAIRDIRISDEFSSEDLAHAGSPSNHRH